jgi:hypothetical protein
VPGRTVISEAGGTPGCATSLLTMAALDPKRTRQMIRLADGVVFDYVVPIFNMVTSTAKDSNGA